MARYIVPAEMPKSCAHCQFSFWVKGRTSKKEYRCALTGLSVCLELNDFETKADWCPLVDAADIVPKSEVAKEFTCFVGDPHKVDHCPYLDEIEKAKTDAAREIFDKIEKQLARYSHIHRYAEEAKEVTEEYADGSPVEMTSVWDACRLEHNGYDDYETMCKLQDNIGNIEKSRLLKEIEGDIDDFKKEYTEEKS